MFNNNVVLAKDATGEVIATGRGIGFKARPGQAVDKNKVVRIFVPADGRDPDHLAELLADIPIENIKLMTEAAAVAGLSETASQSPTLLMALADHIGFAIQRAQQGERIEYPLLGEVLHLYREEYSQARKMVDFVNARLLENSMLPLQDTEAVALTLHLVNAGFSTGDLSFTYKMTGVLEQLISVIEEFYGIALPTDTVSVGRFITHLRYLFVRLQQHSQLEGEPSAIGEAIRQSSPDAYQCAQTLASVVELRLGTSLTEDEISYLTLHVARIADSARKNQEQSKIECKKLTTQHSSTHRPSTEQSRATGTLSHQHRKDPSVITRTATIGSSVGLHARPASLFTAAAAEYDYDIVISMDDEEADAASILEVMTLGAKHGDVVTLSCDDDAAADALDALAAMLERDLDAE